MNRYFAGVMVLSVIAGVIAALARHGVPYTGAWTTGVMLAVAYWLGQCRARSDVRKKVAAATARFQREREAAK